MTAFESFYNENVPRLRRKIASYNEALAQDDNALLRPFRAYMADLNEGGKCLRGLLVNLGYRLAGHDTCEESDGAALAFEFFQTGVLIHDDIIDKASYRRGKKTMTVRYNESMTERGLTPPASGDTRESLSESAALCCGDYLITAANLFLAEQYSSHPCAVPVIAEFDRIILNTIRGELLDVVLPTEITDPAHGDNSGELLMTSVYDIYHLKTSQYSVVGPLHLGMLLGGMKPEEMALVDALADELGIAFQIKDDLLGIYGDEEIVGKDIGSDISEFKQTILYAFMKCRAADRMPELLQHYGKSPATAEDVAAVRTIFEETGARRFAEDEMNACFERAGRQMEEMTFIDEGTKAVLRDFIDYCRNRLK
ncbi:MAG: polyprenyl synthetase family protein [Lachnospiraceae bacterium]|nr:polyprenyl synthetase family protein [Lachnospiraceae bacterium]